MYVCMYVLYILYVLYVLKIAYGAYTDIYTYICKLVWYIAYGILYAGTRV